jgi:uncharacterized membrane protein
VPPKFVIVEWQPVERPRFASLDVIRGAVMVLMALDHVRVFSGLPPGGPDPGIFFTRWVTHFCAPDFVFLAGVGAWLSGRGRGTRWELTRFLVVRGLGLVVLELTVIRLGWTFNADSGHYLLAGVIWAIGWCMVLLAALVHLPRGLVGTLGLGIMAGHNLADPWVPRLVAALRASGSAWLGQILYFGGLIPLPGGSQLVILYSLVPWVGVMAAGFGFGAVMEMDGEGRRRTCLRLGWAAVAAFAVLRVTRLYGDPRPWNGASVLDFLSTTKYPASLQFLLMTLGPTVALIPWLERARGSVARTLALFGRVPLFYYVLHIPLAHAAACVVSLLREGRVVPWLFENHPMMMSSPPDGYVWSLPQLYAVTVAVVAILYFPCRWYAGLKSRRDSRWLRFL